MNTDLSGIAELLVVISNWFKSTYVTFGGVTLSLWSIFVTGSVVAIITRVLYGKGGQDDD